MTMKRTTICAAMLLLLAVVTADAVAQQPFKLEFSVDIGSDTELSDPNRDGDEVFDPGDVYWNDGVILVPPGASGPKDDAVIFGFDPPPKGGHPSSAVPVGNGSVEQYGEFFDLDGHDQIDWQLIELLPGEGFLEMPIPLVDTLGVFPLGYLAISMDDDDGPGWPVADVPVTTPSMAGSLYGTTGGFDEVIEITLAPIGGGLYGLNSLTPAATETMVHPNLQPDPTGEDEDDDIDSLDVVGLEPIELVWTFSADHEAHMGLDPADIYMPSPTGGAVPWLLVDGQRHLGLRDGTDVDAFEFVWLSPDPDILPSLAVLFSVDNDDPLTPVDESGGLDPRMIYVSFMLGQNQPLLAEPLWDDIDAIANWYEPIAPEPEEIDWGDAPDRPYPTLAANNGANHLITPNLFLGASVDPEPDGQPTPAADGDDNDGNDDEDGVSFGGVFRPGASVPVTVVASAPGLLQGWVDFNGNGSWADLGEQVFIDAALTAGPNTLTINVPTWSIMGVTFARFRFSTANGLSFTGQAPDGEVEDYRIHIDEPIPVDWGDAPDMAGAPSYPTLAASNGANHTLGSQLYLGLQVDAELDGQPTMAADGDDLNGVDDEDGVNFVTALLYGRQAKVDVVASQAGMLDAWIDYNADGDWTDAGEQIFAAAPVNPGLNTLTFTLPAMAPGPVRVSYARFRLSSAGGLAPGGAAPDGEVEDYRVKLASVGSISGTKVWDVNADGALDAAEPRLAGFTVYADLNNNGQLDVGEPSAVTSSTGQYTLVNLAPGSYTVRQVADPLWRITAPSGGSHTVTVNSGQWVSGINFGDWMLGDLDFDQDVDADDIDLEGAAIQGGLTGSLYDLNGDGTVDDDDLTTIVEDLVFVGGDPTDRGTYFGDADLDGDVDLDDFAILKINFGVGSGWAQGDFDVDGDVDLDDFAILKTNFGASAAP